MRHKHQDDLSLLCFPVELCFSSLMFVNSKQQEKQRVYIFYSFCIFDTTPAFEIF